MNVYFNFVCSYFIYQGLKLKTKEHNLSSTDLVFQVFSGVPT